MAVPGNIEIGCPEQHELDQMLRVMCAGFGLPFEPARAIFRDDPYFNIDNKRVLRIDGKVISCLSIIEAASWIGSATVPIAGIAGVATLDEYRGMGFAKLLLIDSIELLKTRKYPISGLFAINREYYRRLGWESASFVYEFKIPRTAFHSACHSSDVRPVTTQDIPQLIKLYDGASQGKSLRLKRDKKRWKYLLQHVPNTVLFQKPGCEPEGYLQFQSLPGTIDLIYPPKNTPASLRVLEMITNSEAALIGLRSHLFNQSFAENISFSAPIAELQHMIGLDLLTEYPPSQKPGVMLKILNFEQLIRLLSANWKKLNGRISLGIKYSCGDSSESVTVINEDGNARVESSDEYCPAMLCGDEKYWVQVISGYMSAEFASACGLLKWSSPPSENETALIKQMFPARDPFVPNADQF